MATAPTSHHLPIYRSIIFKNLVLFLLILLVAVVPLALRYYEDSRDYEIQNLASKLEFFAERGASWLDVPAITTVIGPEDEQTSAYQNLLTTLQRIQKDFGVDDAVVMRRQPDGHYVYVAISHGQFEPGQAVHIHPLFPATYDTTEATWQRGSMVHSELFGGKVLNPQLSTLSTYLCRLSAGLNDAYYWQRWCSTGISDWKFGQFLQINNPLKLDGKVVAILMLNKEAESVAKAVQMKTLNVIGLSSIIVAAGLVLFGFISAHMLRPLKDLTRVAGQVAQGNLDVTLPHAHGRDEVGRLSVTFEGMIEGLRQRDFIRDTFGRYISKEVVEELLGSPDGLRLGGEIREVTFLVSDLRGFSSLASRLDPHTVITIINRYLERMIAILIRYRGTVDEFQGDGILAFFGAPLAAADDAERAIACAIEMQKALVEINAEQRRLGLPELAMGIGINVGKVIVGNIGSEQRTKYGAMGSPINTAYRIESYTVGGQVLLSPTLYERVQDLVHIRSTMTVEFKGVDQPVTLYDIGGIGGHYNLSLPEKVPDMFTTLAPPLPITCYTLDGKTVTDDAVPGYLTDLASSSAKAVLEGRVAVHDNLKISLTPEHDGKKLEAYVKVVALDTIQLDHKEMLVSLEFTSVSEDTKAFLEHRRSDVLQETQKHGL